ncbi:hypothetical protein Taro_012838, partial [Colocasia esculenta]|nr:hypothetical protein [Colocasia esculenta]
MATGIQGYAALTVRPQLRSAGGNLRCFVAFCLVSTNKLACLRNQFHVRGPPITLPKEKPLKVFLFKSSGQHDEAHDTSWDPKVSKNAVHLAYEPQERVEILSVSPDMTSIELSYASDNREAIAMRGPQTIQNLFKRWLTMLYSEAPIETVDGIYTRSPVHAEISESEEVFLRQKAENVLKAAFLFFQRLDATIKTPLLIFYIAEGKLQAFLYAHLCQLIVDVRNIGYNKLMKQKLMQVNEWALEKYLDYVESLWPYYCRTI